MRHPSFYHALAGACALLYFTVSIGSQPVPARRGPTPVPFLSPDRKTSGWKITIPGGRPLATPALADGDVLVGRGFGSHEFYAFAADAGNPRWVYHTADDGPTAAAVSERTGDVAPPTRYRVEPEH